MYRHTGSETRNVRLPMTEEGDFHERPQAGQDRTQKHHAFLQSLRQSIGKHNLRAVLCKDPHRSARQETPRGKGQRMVAMGIEPANRSVTFRSIQPVHSFRWMCFLISK